MAAQSKKTVIRFFTIADYEEEEAWLHNQHRNGYKLVKMIPPCFFIFEQCTPEDVAYQLDYKNNVQTGSYFQMFRDYGWEYIGQCFGWRYFRKPLSGTGAEQDSEIFSDSESRMDMIDYVIKTRLVPLMLLFVCCVLPNLFKSIAASDPFAAVFTVIFAVMTLVYLYLILYCGLKLRKLRKRYR